MAGKESRLEAEERNNMSKYFNDIFSYVLAQETAFKQPIPIFDSWEWSFYEHIKTTIFYLFGRLLTGNSDLKPVKNIVRRILKFRYAAEDIDVKNISIYADDPDKFHLSFLIKKYYDDVFVRESKLDKKLDSIKKERINFGGVLVQNEDGIPKKIPLSQLAFCDQSNIMGAPFAIKLSMSPSELLEMKGWGDKANGATLSVKELIGLMEYQKQKDKTNERPIKTPGKYYDVYLVWGTMPSEWVGGKEGEFTLQLHFITFLQSKKSDTKNGVTLFAKEDKDRNRFKFDKLDEGDGLENRAVGFGGVEELFEAQVWTNYSMIRKKDFLDAASKVILKTTDSTLSAKHPSGLKDLDNLELVEVEEGKDISQIDTFPRNYQLFNNAVDEWQEYAQGVSFATNPMLGEEAPSGTPFRAQERQVIQGRMPHEESVKEFGRFIEEMHQDWIIPYISNELVKGTKFLSELSRDEMEYVSDCLVRNKANEFKKEKILNGELIAPEEVEIYKQQVRTDFMQGGNKKFIEILKGELKGVSLKVKVSVAGNKDLAGMTDKLTNIFRQIFANPAILDDPRAAKILQKILEFSGLGQIDFSSYKKPEQMPMIQPQMPELPKVATPISQTML